jgi:nitrogen regulatory protein P-II 2
VTAARKMGPRHSGVSEIEGGSIRVEVLASPEVGQKIWRRLRDHYFPHYSVAAWEYPVTVARIERYRDQG